MNTVEPIRNKVLIEKVKEELKKDSYRNYMMFFVGINTGLRSVDLLKLKANDFLDNTHLMIREQKTNKYKRFLINEELKKEVLKYINKENLQKEDHLFYSREGKNKPLTRVMMYNIINKACRNVGITDKIGNHTLRKSWGYHFYKKTKDIALIQDLLNHSSQRVTMRYIGINDDIRDEALKDFSL